MKFSDLTISPGESVECKFTDKNIIGELKIGDRVFSVYLGRIETECVQGCLGERTVKSKFTLIEV